MKYRITSETSGADLGTYEGATHPEALDAMAASGDDGSHLKVTPVAEESAS